MISLSKSACTCPNLGSIGEFKYHLPALGSGSFGEVFLLHEHGLPGQSSRVIKILKSQYVQSAASRSDFEGEGRRHASFKHPNIIQVSVRDYDPITKQPYLVMERGVCSLDHFVVTYFPKGLPSPAVACMLRCILEAVQFIGERGWVHRDIKPDNLLLTQTGPKLIDFGISFEAKYAALEASKVLGTPLFLPPQVRSPQSIYSQKMDVWCVGLVTEFLLDGKISSSLIHNSGFKLPNPQRQKETTAFLYKALHPNHSNRATPQDLLRQPLLSEIAPETLKQCFSVCYDVAINTLKPSDALPLLLNLKIPPPIESIKSSSQLGTAKSNPNHLLREPSIKFSLLQDSILPDPNLALYDSSLPEYSCLGSINPRLQSLNFTQNSQHFSINPHTPQLQSQADRPLQPWLPQPSLPSETIAIPIEIKKINSQGNFAAKQTTQLEKKNKVSQNTVLKPNASKNTLPNTATCANADMTASNKLNGPSPLFGQKGDITVANQAQVKEPRVDKGGVAEPRVDKGGVAEPRVDKGGVVKPKADKKIKQAMDFSHTVLYPSAQRQKLSLATEQLRPEDFSRLQVAPDKLQPRQKYGVALHSPSQVVSLATGPFSLSESAALETIKLLQEMRERCQSGSLEQLRRVLIVRCYREYGLEANVQRIRLLLEGEYGQIGEPPAPTLLEMRQGLMADMRETLHAFTTGADPAAWQLCYTLAIGLAAANLMVHKQVDKTYCMNLVSTARKVQEKKVRKGLADIKKLVESAKETMLTVILEPLP